MGLRSSANAVPARRIPVPASRTQTTSSAAMDTHTVLPPNRMDSGPALAREPREPQTTTFTGRPTQGHLRQGPEAKGR
jgi:hypothetical protein